MLKLLRFQITSYFTTFNINNTIFELWFLNVISWEAASLRLNFNLLLFSFCLLKITWQYAFMSFTFELFNITLSSVHIYAQNSSI